MQAAHHYWLSCLQKEHGAPLAVPLFVILAQNRALHVIGEDRGVGNVDGWKKPEDRIRVVSDRFDQANKLLVQASFYSMSQCPLALSL